MTRKLRNEFARGLSPHLILRNTVAASHRCRRACKVLEAVKEEAVPERVRCHAELIARQPDPAAQPIELHTPPVCSVISRRNHRPGDIGHERLRAFEDNQLEARQWGRERPWPATLRPPIHLDMAEFADSQVRPEDHASRARSPKAAIRSSWATKYSLPVPVARW